MITSREINYVGKYPNQVPYPGEDYMKQAIAELKKAFSLYNEYYLNRDYSFIFTDDSEIEFEILSKNLAHILGINSDIRFDEGFKKQILNSKEMNTYNLLVSIMKDLDRAINYDIDNNNRYFNYYRIMVKCSIFNRLSKFTDFNFGCINTDKEKYKIVNGEEFKSNAGKMLFINSNEAISPYYMMGIIRGKDSERYFVETLIAPLEISTRMMFDCQRIVFPKQILTSNGTNLLRLVATPEDKMKMHNLYARDIRNYGGFIDVEADYWDVNSDLVQAKKRSLTK